MIKLRDLSWTEVNLPERDLAGTVLEFAAPLLEKLGPAPVLDEARAAISLAIAFWNASVLASKRWSRRRVKELNELRRRLRKDDAAVLTLLTERWRKHWLDPRLVDSWSFELRDSVPRLICTMRLPKGVRAVVPPAMEKRISIGGRFLDEVRIALVADTFLGFPVENFSGVIAEDGTATVRAMMQPVLQLFAEGRLPRIGGDPVELVIGRRKVGPMVLAGLRCGGENYRYDIAILTFRPA